MTDLGKTITSQYGNTPQGQQIQSLADTLASITGSPTMGTFLAAAQAGPNYSQTDIPQSLDNEDKLRTLFANDQALAARYYSPNLYGGGTTPPASNLAGAFSSPLQATTDSINNPGWGMDTPANTKLIAGEIGGQEDALSKVMGAIDFTKTRSDKAYEEMLSALSTLVQSQNAKELEMIKQGYISGDGSGTTAQDYADAFLGGQVDWSDIPSNMKPVVTKIVKSSGSTVQKVQDGHSGLKNSARVLNGILDSWTNLSPQEKILPQGLIEAIPALSPTRAKIRSLFYTTLQPELRKAAIGGRITQPEIKWIRDAILPGPLDTEASARAKVEGVLQGIYMKMQNPDYTPVGTNAQDITGGYGVIP
jgi:hypothetical protein